MKFKWLKTKRKQLSKRLWAEQNNNSSHFKVTDVWNHTNTSSSNHDWGHRSKKDGEHECFITQSYPFKSMRAAFPSDSAVTLLSVQTVAPSNLSHPTLSCSRLNQVNDRQLTCQDFICIVFSCLRTHPSPLLSCANIIIHKLFCRIIFCKHEYGVYTTSISILMRYGYWAWK